MCVCVVPLSGMARETVTVPSPKVLYVSDPSEALSLTSPRDDGSPSSGGVGGSLASPPVAQGGKRKLKQVGLATMFIESQRRSSSRSAEEREKRERAARSTELLNRFFECLCRHLHLTPSGFLKQCAEETYVFVFLERVRQVLDEIADPDGEPLTVEETLTMLHKSRFPVENEEGSVDGGKCWFICGSRIASDCVQ